MKYINIISRNKSTNLPSELRRRSGVFSKTSSSVSSESDGDLEQNNPMTDYHKGLQRAGVCFKHAKLHARNCNYMQKNTHIMIYNPSIL